MIEQMRRVDVYLRDHRLLVKLMKFNDHSVRTLADRVGSTRSTIGHLRSGRRGYCDDVLAKRIAKALDVPADLLFEVRSSTVSREVARPKQAA